MKISKQDAKIRDLNSLLELVSGTCKNAKDGGCTFIKLATDTSTTAKQEALNAAYEKIQQAFKNSQAAVADQLIQSLKEINEICLKFPNLKIYCDEHCEKIIASKAIGDYVNKF